MAVAGASALMLSFTAFPALAIGDGKVPADNCSGNVNAVGTPQGDPNPGLALTDQVGPPASGNNPGQEFSPGETGAEGEEKSQAIANCN